MAHSQKGKAGTPEIQTLFKLAAERPEPAVT